MNVITSNSYQIIQLEIDDETGIYKKEDGLFNTFNRDKFLKFLDKQQENGWYYVGIFNYEKPIEIIFSRTPIGSHPFR